MFSIWRQQQSQKEHFSDLFMYWFWMSKGKKLNTFFQFKFSQFITKRNIINDLFTFCNYFLLLLLLFFFLFSTLWNPFMSSLFKRRKKRTEFSVQLSQVPILWRLCQLWMWSVIRFVVCLWFVSPQNKVFSCITYTYFFSTFFFILCTSTRQTNVPAQKDSKNAIFTHLIFLSALFF